MGEGGKNEKRARRALFEVCVGKKLFLRQRYFFLRLPSIIRSVRRELKDEVPNIVLNPVIHNVADLGLEVTPRPGGLFDVVGRTEAQFDGDLFLTHDDQLDHLLPAEILTFILRHLLRTFDVFYGTLLFEFLFGLALFLKRTGFSGGEFRFGGHRVEASG